VEEHAAAGSGTLGIGRRRAQPWKGDTCIVPPFQGCSDRPFKPRAVVAARPSPWALLCRASGAKPRQRNRCHGCEDVAVFMKPCT